MISLLLFTLTGHFKSIYLTCSYLLLITSPPIAVVSQPQPVPIAVEYLRGAPGLVRCPHCSHLVTKLHPRFLCLCFRLICGFCLIPLMVRGMQDTHHSCPQCGNALHVHKR
uniref:LITAF domain-containing protein n=1 Tax=Oreochromis niloticus TaxID=8128 RepID=A0A669BB74_ORENI